MIWLKSLTSRVSEDRLNKAIYYYDYIRASENRPNKAIYYCDYTAFRAEDRPDKTIIMKYNKTIQNAVKRPWTINYKFK